MYLYAVKTEVYNKHTGCNPMKVFMPFQHLNGKTSSLKVAEPGPLGLGAQFLTINSRRRIMHSSRTQSASVICQSALVSLFLHICSYLSSMPFVPNTMIDLSHLISIICST